MDTIRKNEHYSYADYASWNDNSRCELIDGVPYLMSPAPAPKHQEVLLSIGSQFYNFLKGKPCKVFLAPFDVRLNHENGDDTIVQPDLLVICDQTKIDDKGCKGAPDFVLEILSPSTARHDMLTKFNKYLEAGVREYWMVNPDIKTIMVNILENGRYIASAFSDLDNVPVSVLDGCVISMPEVFAN